MNRYLLALLLAGFVCVAGARAQAASATNASPTNAPPSIMAMPAQASSTNGPATNAPSATAAVLPATTTNLPSANSPALAAPASTNAAPIAPAPAEIAQPTVIQTFEGAAVTSTPFFTVADRWEVRWSCLRVISVAVFSSDGSLVTGAAGVLKGSLYIPKGGTYYLRIGGENDPDASPNDSLTDAANGGFSASAWHVIVVELGPTSPPNPLLSVYKPNFIPPYSAGPPGSVAPAPEPPPPTPPAAPALTDAQARAVVLIAGDNSSGTGFLVKTPDGPVVMTSFHVIADNPNLKVTDSSGGLINVVSIKIATDRDLAMLGIQDADYSYLEMCTDISGTAQPGDAILTPGVSSSGDPTPVTPGFLRGINADRVDFDNQIAPGNSGGPVIHAKSGTVLGVVTGSPTVDASGNVELASFASRDAAISRTMHYYGLRVDTVAAWNTVDGSRLQVETAFLDQFHQRSRALDSYLNPSNHHHDGSNDGPDPSELYRNDAAIMKANILSTRQAAGTDTTGHLDALRSLLFDLNSIADTDMEQIENKSNFYPYDQIRAAKEIAYRKALKAEIELIGTSTSRMRSLPKPD